MARPSRAARGTTPLGTVPPDLTIFETPVIAPDTQSRRFANAILPVQRQMVVRDAGPHTRKVTVDYFFKTVLPPLHKKINLPAVIEKLKKNGTIRDGRFAQFPLDPKDASGSEPEVFLPLGEITQKIVKAAKSNGMKVMLHFYNAGSIVPTSKRRTCHSKPDFIGGLFPCDENEPPKWRDVFLIGEFKLHNQPATAHKASRLLYPC